MRELIPVPQENISDILLNVGPKSVNVSNGYYGYQPHVHLSDTGRPNIEEAPVKMEVQNHDLEDNVQMQMKNTFWRDFDPCLKRKRQRDVAEDFGTAKKHKESSGVKCLPSPDNGKGLLEDMLWRTHGVSVYQWNGQ